METHEVWIMCTRQCEGWLAALSWFSILAYSLTLILTWIGSFQQRKALPAVLVLVALPFAALGIEFLGPDLPDGRVIFAGIVGVLVGVTVLRFLATRLNNNLSNWIQGVFAAAVLVDACKLLVCPFQCG